MSGYAQGMPNSSRIKIQYLEILHRMLRRFHLLLGLVLLFGAPAHAGSMGPRANAKPDRGGKIGLLISKAPIGAHVAEVLPDTPAARAGLKEGDTIVTVEGKKLAGLELSQMIKHIVGPTGTKVVLTIRRRSQRLTLTLRRAAIGKLYNDALREPKVAKLVERIVKKQGGKATIHRVAALTVVARSKKERWRFSLSTLGYSFAQCSGATTMISGGRRGGRRWGNLPAESPRRQVVELMQKRPYLLLPNLTAADFADKGYRLQYQGVLKLNRPKWVSFATPKRVHRFEFEAETFDFDPRTLRLIRHRRVDGQQIFFRGQKRFGAISAPTRWVMESASFSVISVSSAPLTPARLTPAGGATCRP